MTAVRVLLADDQELVRAGLRMMVDSAPDLAVVAEAATGRQAVRLAREAQADVVLMDIRMPELDGLAATRQITADEDLAGVKVLILTTFEVDEYVFDALRSGASGFLGKGSRPDVLLDAIRTVARGDALLSPADEWIINGEKWFISAGRVVGLLFVMCVNGMFEVPRHPCVGSRGILIAGHQTVQEKVA
jgi:DNA-binding NarL/FixJ family response regulator